MTLNKPVLQAMFQRLPMLANGNDKGGVTAAASCRGRPS
jgi:hypothetical protein